MLCSMTRSSGIAFIGLSTAGIFIWLLTTEQVHQHIAEFVVSIATNKYLVLLTINLILLFAGCFMDSIPALIILGRVFTPLGACLFTVCAFGKGGTKEIIHYILALIVAVFLVTYIPAISLTIPRLLGFT